MLYKKATKTSCGKTLKRQLAKHDRLNFWDVNISFNLGQSQRSSSVANAKAGGLDMTLDNLVDFANESL